MPVRDRLLHAIHFGVCLSIYFMIAFTDDHAIMHQHRADHRVGRNAACAQLCQLDAATHKNFVYM